MEGSDRGTFKRESWSSPWMVFLFAVWWWWWLLHTSCCTALCAGGGWNVSRSFAFQWLKSAPHLSDLSHKSVECDWIIYVASSTAGCLHLRDKLCVQTSFWAVICSDPYHMTHSRATIGRWDPGAGGGNQVRGQDCAVRGVARPHPWCTTSRSDVDKACCGCILLRDFKSNSVAQLMRSLGRGRAPLQDAALHCLLVDTSRKGSAHRLYNFSLF